ncbi:MAG: hypothetical protein D4R65_11255 [Verrucomicrobiaceae bacterium]|nr:MAG: hypothetical protein D4R65_11255 [Verrucomicrobiaceae bacterium]
MNFVTTDSWREWCDSVYWCDAAPRENSGFRAGDVVFCKIDEVLKLFERLRLTRKRIVLVTGEGDFPCDEFRQKFLPANVVRWFAMNVTASHPRVTAYPLGLGSPRSGATLRAEEISAARAAGMPRDRWLYVNFRPDTNLAVRQPAFEFFRDYRGAGDWITFQPASEHGSNGSFLDALVRHRFVLCPPGNGVDTHRMWEALLAGTVPVVLRSQAMEPFVHLPILFVEDFRELTRGALVEAFSRIQVPRGAPEEMSTAFWGEAIRRAGKPLEGDEQLGWREWGVESVKYGAGMLGRRLKKASTTLLRKEQSFIPILWCRRRRGK